MIGERPSVTANLILPILIRPILRNLEQQSEESAREIRLALMKSESAFPGLISEIITKLTRQVDPNLNMTRALLSLQGSLADFEDPSPTNHPVTSPEGSKLDILPLAELNRRSATLKRILSRIPNEISDRKLFLETIKEIASAIKKLLDCLTDIIDKSDSASQKQDLEDRKRDFIKFSKRFSNKLKEFFKEGQAEAVFTSAAHLINQTYAIQLLIKSFD